MPSEGSASGFSAACPQENAAESGSKRIRTSRGRSRYGCLTCKVRRVKVRLKSLSPQLDRMLNDDYSVMRLVRVASSALAAVMCASTARILSLQSGKEMCIPSIACLETRRR
jgi:hypothetical protein